MKPPARRALRVAIGLAIALVVALVVRAWVVPAVIARELTARLHGPAKFDGWWLAWSSAGVTGLTVREGPGADSAAWLTADAVETDLSIAGLLRGRRAPGRIELRRPRIALKFDEKGDLLTKGPFEAGGAATALPDVVIESGELSIDQKGRPSLTIRGISGGLQREEDVEDLELDGRDPDWGTWTVRGRFDRDFKNGSARLASGPGFVANPERAASVPFVPPDVWKHIVPAGPVDVAVTISLTEGAPKPLHVRTEVTFRGATAGLPTLGIEAKDTTGRITVDDGLVRLEGLAGRSLSGSISATGALDFRGPSPRFDLQLTLDKIDVARAPASWQLGELGASGRLTGKAHLIVAMKPDGADLTGTTGEAVVDGAVLQGIPIKSLLLVMRGQGGGLRYDTKSPLGWAPPRARDPRLWAVPTLVALQDPKPRFHLPESITTHIELEDVDLSTILARLELATRIRPPVPMAGKLSLKAVATIPLGHVADLKDYTIRGRATLKAASIAAVDLGRLDAAVRARDGRPRPRGAERTAGRTARRDGRVPTTGDASAQARRAARGRCLPR